MTGSCVASRRCRETRAGAPPPWGDRRAPRLRRRSAQEPEPGRRRVPPYLCMNGQVKPEFAGLSVVLFDQLTIGQRDSLFAMGSERANLQIGFTMLNVLFLREHNRIAGHLARRYPARDDERLFPTTRHILIVVLLKLVMEEYINHITPYHFRFRLTTALADAPWQRENWASAEFNLVYRWHSLIPSTLRVGGKDLPLAQTLMAGALGPPHRPGTVIQDTPAQPAG